MKVGMFTGPLNDEPLKSVLDFAEYAGIPCLEVWAGPGSRHIDPARLTAARAARIKVELAERGIEMTSLAYYTMDLTDPKATRRVQAHAKKCIDAAALLEVPVVCMLTGGPAPDMSKHQTITKILPKLFRPILTHARKKGIRIALENYFESCLQGLDTFDALFDAIPDDHFGLNYDPSHLYHMQCDHLAPIAMFSDRIFHTHAKDTLVDKIARSYVGVYGSGWWRYVIPGFGNINWGEYISHLRHAGYDGVLSIEHEDETQSVEEGFMRGAAFLEQFC